MIFQQIYTPNSLTSSGSHTARESCNPHEKAKVVLHTAEEPSQKRFQLKRRRLQKTRNTGYKWVEYINISANTGD
jgi:hypothetical protein